MTGDQHHPITALINEVETLSPLEAAEQLGSHPQEIIRDVLSALPHDQAISIASHLPGTVSPGQADTVELADTVTGTVSELMARPIGALTSDITVAGALDHLVHTQPSSTITYVFVIDPEEKLVGVVAMRDLLLASPRQTLAEIMTPDPFVFDLDTSLSAAVNAAMKKRYRLYPVVDNSGRLTGLVYAWQLYDRVAEEISGQSGAMVGIDREERVTTHFLKAFKMRHPWLQVNLFTAFAAAFVVGIFEDTIARIVALAVFLPVLAGQSGNTGCQALAITLRGMTLGELGDFPVRKLLRKETILGAMNGAVVGLVAALAMFFYATMTGTGQPLLLALVVWIAMVGACIGSGIFGVLVPLILKRFGADPATASSIFLTTFTDILGMGLMLFLATALLL